MSMEMFSTLIYLKDPLLFGPMEMRGVRKDGRLSVMVDPDRPTAHMEVFEAHEVEAAVVLDEKVAGHRRR